MAVPLRYNLLNLVVRKAGTILSVASIGLSVGVLVLVLALARGFQITLRSTGSEDNVIVLRKSATSEGESGMSRATFRALQALPAIAPGPDGGPLASAEIYAALSLDRVGGGMTIVPLRGAMLQTFDVRDTARLVEGRRFTPGTHEVVVGRALLSRVVGCRVGGALDLKGQKWPVVGVIDSDGAAYDSEIWCDVEVFMQELDRPGYGLAVLRRATPAPADGPDPLRAEIEGDRRFDAKTFTEPGYFSQQSGILSDILVFLAYFVASIMAIGAAFGTAVTLLASLARRRREIGTLLALGFRPRAVLAGFLVEAVTLGLAGGVVGVLLAWPINGVATGTLNWTTWTETAFAFRITGDVIAQAVGFSTVVGVLAGLLPAWRASRVPPSVALRG